jgi:hypothetical protein
MVRKRLPRRGGWFYRKRAQICFKYFCCLITICLWTIYVEKQSYKRRHTIVSAKESELNKSMKNSATIVHIVLNCLILKSCDLILTVSAWPTMPLAFMSRDKSRHSSSQISVHKKQVRYDKKVSRVADPDSDQPKSALFLEAGSGSSLEWNAGSRSALQSKFRIYGGSKQSDGGARTLTTELCRFKT